MDFIERWFSIAPDGGNGTLELLWLVAFVISILAVLFRRQIGEFLSLRRTDQS
jgi:hypothetical protein